MEGVRQRRSAAKSGRDEAEPSAAAAAQDAAAADAAQEQQPEEVDYSMAIGPRIIAFFIAAPLAYLFVLFINWVSEWQRQQGIVWRGFFRRG